MADVVAVSRAGRGASSLTERVAVQIQPARRIRALCLEMGAIRTGERPRLGWILGDGGEYIPLWHTGFIGQNVLPRDRRAWTAALASWLSRS